MDEKQTHKLITSVINTTFVSHLLSPCSKLSQIQQLYGSKQQRFSEQISEIGRKLTKKIFATRIKSIHSYPNQHYLFNQVSLISLSFVILRIIFEDGYIMKLIIQQINNCNEYIAKIFKVFNPYKSIQITADNAQKIFAAVIIKINQNRSIFKIDDILRHYYTGCAIFSLFLRTILVKIVYTNSQNLKITLDNTQQIFTLLCDYFDINIVAHRAASLRRKNKITNNNQLEIGNKAQVYLFTNYNLFISTADNQQFCFGKFYSNQTELLQYQDDLRKSMKEYLSKLHEINPKQVHDQQQSSGFKLELLRTSGYDADLGSSAGGMAFSGQIQTPYFSNSNADTPQFGNLLDQIRLKKSLNFQTAIKLIDNKNQINMGYYNNVNIINNPNTQDTKQNTLGVVEEQMGSPKSRFDRLFQHKSSYSNVFFLSPQPTQQPNMSKKLKIKTKITSIPSQIPSSYNKNKYQYKIQDDDIHKPLSPPSIQMSQCIQKIQFMQNNSVDNSRDLTYQQNKYFIKIRMQQKQKQRQIQKKQQQEQSIEIQNITTVNKLEMRLKIPQIHQKSFIYNSDKSESEAQINQKQIKQFVNLPVKESQHFINIQQNIPNLSSSKRRDYNLRKYSANQIITNHQLNQLKNRGKNSVHYSNHIADSPKQQMDNINMLQDKKQGFSCWDQTNSNNKSQIPQSSKNNFKKMEISLNTVNFQYFKNHNQIKQTNTIQQKKSTSGDRLKRKNDMQKKFAEFKIRMSALRQIKSSRSQTSQRRRHNMSLSKHVSQNCYQSSPNKNSIIIKKAQHHKRLSIHQQFQPVSNLKKKQCNKDQHKNVRKNSKFPEFLRNCRNRKNIKNQQKNKQQNNQVGNRQGIIGINNLKSTKNCLSLKLKQLKTQYKEKNRKSVQKIKSLNQINNKKPNFNQVSKYSSNQNSYQAASIKIIQNPQFSNYQPQRSSIYLNQHDPSFYNKNKHTQFQPQLFQNIASLQQYPNQYMLTNDFQYRNYFNKKPQQYLRREESRQLVKSSLFLQNRTEENEVNHNNQLARQSFSYNFNELQKVSNISNNFNKNQPLIYSHPNAFIKFGNNKPTNIKNNPQQLQYFPFQSYQIPTNQVNNLTPYIKMAQCSKIYPAQSYQLKRSQIQNIYSHQIPRQKTMITNSNNFFSPKANSLNLQPFNNQSQFKKKKQPFKPQLFNNVLNRKVQ